MKVEQFINSNGNPQANHFIIRDKNKTVFQSYDSVIVEKKRVNGETKVRLDRKTWNYSKTTSKYRNQFLNETTAETQAKIDSGEYKLANLNK